MKIKHLLGIGLVAAMFAAACDNGSTGALKEGGKDPGGSSGSSKAGETEDDDDDDNGETTPGGTTPGGTNDPPVGNVPTQSIDGKAFYIKEVHPNGVSACVGCHQTAGPGPAFLNTDAETSYKSLFVAGYVVQQSRMVLKGPHGGSTTNVLSAAQIAKYNEWVAMELKDGKNTAQPNILATIGQCFDRQKFDAMQLQNWATTQRTNNNNQSGLPNNQWAENANNCTGCNAAPCRTCHTADSSSQYVNASGNPITPSGFSGATYTNSADYTFGESKLTNPNYIRQYFGTSPDGKAVASDGIRKKMESTKKDKKYTHPMYNLNANQLAALDAFVNDAVTRYNAKQCGTTPVTPPAPQ